MLLLVALAVLVERGLERGGVFRPAPEPAAGWRAVERVVDGDTLVLDGGERVRLIGVETPEMGYSPRARVPGVPDPYAEEATEFVRERVERRRVRLEHGYEATDRFERTLAYVYLEDGMLLNAEIIRQGFGRAYRRYPHPLLEEFVALEAEARAAGRGLWARQEDDE